MAWHSGKPADNDFLSASVQYIRENFAELEPLQPHIAALLDSRIVEMGSNANGEYVRWENGLQVCWRQANEGVQIFSQIGALYTVGGTSPQDFLWTYPAAFAQPPVATGSFYRPGVDEFDGFVSIRTLGAESMLYRYYSVVE